MSPPTLHSSLFTLHSPTVTSDLMLRRKWTLRAHGRQVVFVKKANESGEHVLMKALLWALHYDLHWVRLT